MFDAEAYWATREKKKWVVEMRSNTEKVMRGRRLVYRTDRKYVAARDSQGAIRTARAHSLLRGRVELLSCRLATPSDLGAREVTQ